MPTPKVTRWELALEAEKRPIPSKTANKLKYLRYRTLDPHLLPSSIVTFMKPARAGKVAVRRVSDCRLGSCGLYASNNASRMGIQAGHPRWELPRWAGQWR